jgi:hypothetical protein
MREIALALFRSLAPKDEPAALQDAQFGSQTKQHKFLANMPILVQSCWVFSLRFLLVFVWDFA